MLPSIYIRVLLNFNGSPGNIQGSLNRYIHLYGDVKIETSANQTKRGQLLLSEVTCTIMRLKLWGAYKQLNSSSYGQSNGPL